MNSMPIDLATVDWLYVVILAVFVFFATLIGSLLAFGRRVIGALLSAILFAAAFVFWTYYPHHLPLPTALTAPKAAVKMPASATPTASRPRLMATLTWKNATFTRVRSSGRTRACS